MDLPKCPTSTPHPTPPRREIKEEKNDKYNLFTHPPKWHTSHYMTSCLAAGSCRVILWFTLHEWVAIWGSHTARLLAKGNPRRVGLGSNPCFVTKNTGEVTQKMLLSHLHQVFFCALRSSSMLDSYTYFKTCPHGEIICVHRYELFIVYRCNSSVACLIGCCRSQESPTHSMYLAR